MTDLGELTSETIVPFLIDLFEDQGTREYLGESVTMAEHMLQGAALAERGGLDETIIVAALLHDIGHFTSELGSFELNDSMDRLHEQAGADLLARFLPPMVTDCVRHHVSAKRYLCATKPEYFKRLSPASVHSLSLQGGPMSAEEVAEFEREPHLKQIIQVRYLDEAGKRPDTETPPFTHYAPMIQRLVDAHGIGG